MHDRVWLCELIKKKVIFAGSSDQISLIADCRNQSGALNLPQAEKDKLGLCRRALQRHFPSSVRVSLAGESNLVCKLQTRSNPPRLKTPALLCARAAEGGSHHGNRWWLLRQKWKRERPTEEVKSFSEPLCGAKKSKKQNQLFRPNWFLWGSVPPDLKRALRSKARSRAFYASK